MPPFRQGPKKKLRRGLTEDLAERLELGTPCQRAEAPDKEYRDR